VLVVANSTLAVAEQQVRVVQIAQVSDPAWAVAVVVALFAAV